MKRIAYSLLLFLALPAASGFAQGRFMWGFTGGINNSAYHNIPSSAGYSSYTTGYTLGMLGGSAFGYFNWNSISFCEQIICEDDNSSSIRIEIPLTILVPVIRNHWRIYLYAGPDISFGDFDFGITGGLGFSVPVSPKVDLFFQGGYYYGLHNLASNINVEYSPSNGFGPAVSYSVYERDIRIQFGILFGK